MNIYLEKIAESTKVKKKPNKVIKAIKDYGPGILGAAGGYEVGSTLANNVIKNRIPQAKLMKKKHLAGIVGSGILGTIANYQ